MSLSRIILAGLIVLIGLGMAAGVWILVTGKEREQEAQDGRSHWLEDQDLDQELPPPENAWKPTTWYSELADGTLFPNQPSPSFRIPADSSFHRAITRRELEDRAADEPTRPHASFPSSLLHSTEPQPAAVPALPVVPDELEALTQTPTIAMPVVPVKDNLPTTLKMRTARPNRSTYPPEDQDALLHGSDTIEAAELVNNWSEANSGPTSDSETRAPEDQTPISEESGAPALAGVEDQYDHGDPRGASFTEAVHVDFYTDLDAIAISFTGCSVRYSSDVPEAFQIINQKLEQLLAAQDWHQHALLLDIAGLQVAAEAQLAWELVLDGFVSQSCPEVAPNRVLAVQYDSSRPPGHQPTDEDIDAPPDEILQLLGTARGHPARLAVAQSLDEAVRMVQDMRASI